MKQDLIMILDLGSSEVAHLARDIRSMGVYTEVRAHDTKLSEIVADGNVKGIIVYGGKNNIVDGEKIDICNDTATFENLMFIDADSKFATKENSVCGYPSKSVLESFVFEKCKAQKNWNMENFIADQVDLIRKQVGNKKVLLALSGGVDSSVVAAMLIKAVGNNLTCVHVNHGLMRKDESEEVVRVFRDSLKANLVYVDATDRFLDLLKGVDDPEEKRKIIGNEFIKVFEEEARKLDGISFLGQGTIYPDIIESGTKTAKAIKSHHNVGGLPEDLKFELVEPVKYLFKDEVRACGLCLGLPYDMVYRQPFPGPGLGVRCLGAITRDRLAALRESDAILREEIKNAGLDQKIWQYFTVVPEMRSVGVRDSARCFEWACIIRAVNTVDAMTATVPEIDFAVLKKITDRILNEVKGINRVLYDLSPKPCSTIEWE